MGRRAGPQQRGFALLVVLWFLVLIAAIGTYILANARSETAIARNLRTAARAEALADAGLAQTLFHLGDPAIENRWPLDGAPHRFSLHGGEVQVRVSDEGAKINPNLAGPALLAGLFEALGLERPRARALGAAIAEWVGPEAMAQTAGLPAYRDAGRSYGPPHAPMEALDELQLVLGMTPELFAAARPHLTIFTESAEPDPAHASPQVRRALALAAQAPPEPAAPRPDSNPALDADTNTQEAPAPVEAPTAAMPAAPVVRVEIVAQTPDGGLFVRQAVVRLDAAAPKSYQVLDWQRGDLAK
jgi:general secretion pathway protein K